MFRPECLRIENDIYFKVTMEAQLGLIGGTMGLLTGFSILSGVEIIYYLLRLENIFHDVTDFVFTTYPDVLRRSQLQPSGNYWE